MFDFTTFLSSREHAFLGPGFVSASASQGLLVTARHKRCDYTLVDDASVDSASIGELLEGLDALWPTLATDERALFWLGYDAASSLNGLPYHRSEGRLGPDVGYETVSVEKAPAISAVAQPPLKLGHPAQAQAAFMSAVDSLREDILDGVTYQANLAHALWVPAQSRMQAARFFAGAERPRFSAFVPHDFGDWVSLSPECFLRAQLPKGDLEGWALAQPIKGTRPRFASAARDRESAEELLRAPKDRAEHDMIVDLLRNDLGIVSNEVRVQALRNLLSIKNVHHLESDVLGTLLPSTSLSELLRATCPAGSITGAPKSTAVECIHRLEGRGRGPYTGVLGVVDGEGRVALSIMIRTWIRPDVGEGVLHVGGGIVFDSEPLMEWEETLHKARAFGEVVS